MRAWTAVTAGVLVLLAAGTAGAAPGSDNAAFVDIQRTQVVIDQATDALAAVLTYQYRKLDDNERTAADHGTERYLAQHKTMLDGIRATVTKQRLVVTTKTAGAGVRDLRGDTAQLVVFLDQTSTRGDIDQTTSSWSAVVVDLKLVDKQWKLDAVTNTF